MQYYFTKLRPPSVGSCTRCGTKRKSSVVAIEVSTNLVPKNLGNAHLICPDCAPEEMNQVINL